VGGRSDAAAAPRCPSAVLTAAGLTLGEASLLFAVVVAALAGAARWAALRARRARWAAALADPSVDPGAGLPGAIPGSIPSELPTDLPTRVRVLLDATDLERTWRAPLRPLRAEVPALVAAAELGLAAELVGRLGHLDEALALADRAPADEPGACFARHLAYRAAGDEARAEGALVAAVTLAPPADAPRYRRSLERWRREHRRARTHAERLWDPD
jgi:hypothetical protein